MSRVFGEVICLGEPAQDYCWSCDHVTKKKSFGPRLHVYLGC